MKTDKKSRIVILAVVLIAVVGILCLAGGRAFLVRTRGPRPTPLPKASLPWSDDFSDPASGWQTESDTSAEVLYHEGAMRVFVKAPNRLAWAWGGREFSDFRLAVEATQVSGPDDNEYGVQVRMQDNSRFYRFSISGDGYYQISKHDGAEREMLSGDWSQSDAIHLGAAMNLLEVTCQGATMIFSVNGVQLAQVEDADFRRGDVGFYAGSFREPGTGVEIHFDNLTITQP